MEYLLAALKRQARKIRLEQWLLLALRTLVIVLVVLAVAEPAVERSGAAMLAGGRTHRLLVIDVSYSMAYRATDKSRLERAKELAARIVDQSAPGDAFTLVLMASPPRVVVGTPAFEAAAIREEIEHVEVLDTGADLAATLSEVGKLLAAARRDGPRLDRHEVYFLTDLQRVTWAPRLAAAASADLRRQCAELAEAAEVVVIDVGQPAAQNLALTALTTPEAVVTVGRSLSLHAELQNFGRQPRDRQGVELLVDGRRTDRQQVNVPAGGSAGVDFRALRFDTPGDHVLEARAEGDPLEIDNHRYLVVPVRQSVRVLCIDGRPSGEPFQGAADYLALALAPQAGPLERPPIEVQTAAETAILERTLAAYDCVLLANVAQFTASEAKVLEAYLGHGGNLLFFLGDQVQAERYNRELGGLAGPPRIMPARLDTVVQVQQPLRVDPLGYRHPMLGAFAGHEKAGLLSMPVWKYFKLEVPRDAAARVVLRLAGGDPLLVEQPVRRGHVVLVATSADPSWTAWPLWPSYVPMLQEILAWCLRGAAEQRNVEAGEPLAGSLAAAAGEVPVVLERPDGRTRSLPLRTEGDYRTWTFAETFKSGIYTVRLGPPGGAEQRFAVNPDRAESDLAAIGADELENDVWPGIRYTDPATWQGPDARSAGPIAGAGRLPVELLYAVLGLLLLETCVAWRFGHHMGDCPDFRPTKMGLSPSDTL
jgi:hypothetical protein